MIKKEWLFQYKEELLDNKARLLNKKILELTIELDKTKIERNKLMFDLKESGLTLKELSKIFDLSQTAIFDIVLNEERGYKTALQRRYEKNLAKINTWGGRIKGESTKRDKKKTRSLDLKKYLAP